MRINPKSLTLSILFLLATLIPAMAQNNTQYNAITNYYGKPDTVFALKDVDLKIPQDVESFNPVWHFAPVAQDTTSTCWAYSGISFFESEIYRLHGKKIKLSEMYIAYWDFVAKAEEYVRTQGKSLFTAGSENESVLLMMKEHGIVRFADYTGLLPGQERHNHRQLMKQMRAYLAYVKENDCWDEELVISQIKMILNKNMGTPPDIITVDGQTKTPQQFFADDVQLPLDDYVDVMSFIYAPFFTKAEFKVDDNWWHSTEYYNVPLDLWYQGVRNAIKNGYSISIGGDVSEVGKVREKDIAFVPDFDIPSQYINQDAREFRFDNLTTGDDHGIHLVGYQRLKGHDWFLIKDSGSSARKGRFEGYYFFRDDYVKLKMLTYLVHKDAIPEIMGRFK
jgi:bleomycin hydrolase